jgi:ABC-2 type transport system ATP-binding protein
MIQVNSLSKSSGPTIAVQNVSFDIQRREVVGLLGLNGAGKTTTMRMLTCYLPPDHGTAKVAGFDIETQSIEVRRKIGYLPESAPLYTEMGVLDYLDFIAEVRGLSRPQRRQRIQAMVETCGLGDVVKKDIGELSKGYRQRVGLAQTLIHDPDVLVLDEPTSGLDPNQIIHIRELIRDIGRVKTVILSTHIMQEVNATCSRVIIIDRGKIVADGTPNELASRVTGGDRIYVTVRGPQEEVEGRLANVNGVKALRAVENLGEGRVRYEVRVVQGDDPAERIFQMAVDHRWPLSEIRADASSLEDVFVRLTQSDPT